MKNQIVFLMLFVSTIVNAQVLNGVITDLETGLPIHLANITFIEKDKGTYSNIDGKFKLDITNEKEILISSIGYQSQVFNLNDIHDFDQVLVIKLKPYIEKLKEVTITTKKPKYTTSQTLGKPKRTKIRTSLPFGYEFATLIKNPKHQRGILENVVLSLNKSKDFNYLATYNIKFYEYNPIKKEPDNLLYLDNLIVVPENKTHKLKIDVTDLKIPFPKNGICIGVEIVNDKYDQPINSMSIIGPRINFTHTKNPELLTWGRYRSKNWSVKTRKSPIGKGFKNGLVNIQVKYKK